MCSLPSTCPGTTVIHFALTRLATSTDSRISVRKESRLSLSGSVSVGSFQLMRVRDEHPHSQVEPGQRLADLFLHVDGPPAEAVVLEGREALAAMNSSCETMSGPACSLNIPMWGA